VDPTWIQPEARWTAPVMRCSPSALPRQECAVVSAFILNSGVWILKGECLSGVLSPKTADGSGSTFGSASCVCEGHGRMRVAEKSIPGDRSSPKK